MSGSEYYWIQDRSWTTTATSNPITNVYIDKVTPLKRDVRSVLEEYDMLDSIIGEKILSAMAKHLP